MHPNRSSGRLLAALFSTAAGAACAQPASDPTWGVSAAVQHRTLQERDAGRRLLEETGPMLRLALDAQWRLRGGGAFEASAAVAGGDLDYEGQNQAGTPLTTDSAHRDLSFALGWRPLPAASWGEGWLVLRALQQRRKIASTPTAGGLTETSTLVMPGLRWQHAFQSASWRWRPSVELRASAHHRLQIDYGGVFDDSDIRGGRRWEAALALDVSAPDSPWTFGLEWTHARQSASPRQTLNRGGAAVGTVRQPRIAIDDVGVRVRRAF